MARKRAGTGDMVRQISVRCTIMTKQRLKRMAKLLDITELEYVNEAVKERLQKDERKTSTPDDVGADD